MVGVTGSRYLLPIRFRSIRTQKMSKLKMRKSDKKLFQDSEKKNTCISSGHPKSPCKVKKGSAKKVWEELWGHGTYYIVPIQVCNIRTQKMSKLKMQKK